MSDVETIKLAEMQNELRPAPDASATEWAAYNMWLKTANRIDGSLSRLVQVVGKELTHGVPDDGTFVGAGAVGVGQPSGVPDNMEGQWVTAILNDPAMLGAGGLAPIVFNHNLDVPVDGVAGGYPNVRWLHTMFTYGFKGVGAAAPIANPAHNSVHYSAGDPVTNNTIALRVHSNIAIGALAVLTVEIFFVRAVR